MLVDLIECLLGSWIAPGEQLPDMDVSSEGMYTDHNVNQYAVCIPLNE